jgi:hypothetical protein
LNIHLSHSLNLTLLQCLKFLLELCLSSSSSLYLC